MSKLRAAFARLGRPRSAAARFGKAQDGATAMEFGLLITPYMLMIFGIFQISFDAYVGSVLSFATTKAARQIMIGAVQSSNLTADQFRTQQICPSLPSFVSCSDVAVNMQKYAGATGTQSIYYNFVNSTSSGLKYPSLNNANNTYCNGGSGEFVVLQVMYPLSFFSSLYPSTTTVTNQATGTILLMATATFKNEQTASTNTTNTSC